MQAGKHVLTEKLMAHNVAQCKVMGRVAEKQDKFLAVGHQRHYSVLYDNAVNLHAVGPARRVAPHPGPVAPRQPARGR